MMFPENITIEEVREVIAKQNSVSDFATFVESDKGEYIVFSYLVSPIFPDADSRHGQILRECRGLKFYRDGSIAARPYSKFFNLNERPETQIGHIDWNEPHIILSKLDGSMITPFVKNNGAIEWHTKRGFTEVSKPVMDFIQNNPHYEIMANYFFEKNMTPIFEWCSKKQKIVIDYPVDRLVLTAVRNNISGTYTKYDHLVQYGNQFGIEVVSALRNNVGDVNKFVEETRDLKNEEGYVVRFDSGLMVKLKADQYVRIHKSKDEIRFEKNVLALIVNDEIDDILPIFDEEDQNAINAYRNSVDQNLSHHATRLENIVNEWKTKGDKKNFATNYVKNIRGLESGLLFSIWDGKNSLETMFNLVKSKIFRETTIPEIRQYIGEKTWYDFKSQPPEE